MAEYPSANPFQVEPDLTSRLAAAKERVWFRIGVLQSTMNDRERALKAFQRVLEVNPTNVRAMTQAGAVLAKKECYPQAVAYLQRAITQDGSCGEAWAVLAHCYVMSDDLRKAYQAYQSALSHLPNPKDPNLWYGIGLLYDRYGSLDHALEAFLAVLSISPDFERADEVCFCIGIIYKEQQNFDEALRYFNKVVIAANPPPPLTRADGWYQIGHVYELKRDIQTALEMYKRALGENPQHPKTLQNLGWLEHQHNNNSQEAIRLLKLSADNDANDGQTWYLLGRVHMALREFRQAYDAYQQAVYRDGGNATFWCSIGVLYYQMNQYRDAMDAYSRAIRLNPYVSEVWYDLGTLYESCGQNGDAIDAYRRAAELAPENTQITNRLRILENPVNPSSHPQPGTSQPTSQPQPQQAAPDMHNAGEAQMPQQQQPSQHAQQQPPIPSVGRTMAGSVHQLSQPASHESKIPQQQPSIEPPRHHPPPHLSSQQMPIGQQPGAEDALSRSMPSRTGQVGIQSFHPPGIPLFDQVPAQNGNYSHGRSGLQPPVSSMPLPSPQNHISEPARPSIMSQALPVSRPTPMGPSQPQPLNLGPPPLGAGHEGHEQLQRSTSMPQTQLQPLPKMEGHDQQQGFQHPHIPQIEIHQPSQALRAGPLRAGPLPPVSVDDQHQPTRDTQLVSAVLPSPLPRLPSSEPHGQERLPPPPEAPRQHVSTPTQPMSQHATPSLPKIQPLHQMQPIPQMRQQPPEEEKRLDTNSSRREGDLTVSSAMTDHGAGRRSYGNTEDGRRMEFEGEGKRDGPRLPALQNSGLDIDNAMPSKSAGIEVSPPPGPSYSAGLETTSSREQVPSRGEGSRDVQQPAPGPSRSMSMHEITQPNDDEQRVLPQTEKRTDEKEVEAGRVDHPRSENEQRHDKMPESAQLPALRPLSGAPAMNAPSREHGEEPKPLQSLPTPTLALPSGNALPSLANNRNENTTLSPPKPGPSVPVGSSSLGPSAPSLPPLSTRTPVALGSEPRDGPGQSPLAHGESSFTKFGKGIGRTPVTPVSNSVAPSSLPSPLPTKKNSSTSLHAVRSPHSLKPSGGPPFKSVPVVSSGPNYGPIESVPSPSSLPVLPALSSRATRDDSEKDASQGARTEQENTLGGEDRGDNGRSKGGEESGKEVEADRRRPDESLTNRPIFGMLRSAPAPMQSPDRTQGMQDDGTSSPRGNSLGRGGAESVHPGKREVSGKDDSGRTAKRPRLQEVDEMDTVSKPYPYKGIENEGKGSIMKNDSETGDERSNKIGSGDQSDKGSLKDTKTDVRGRSSSPKSDGDRRHASDGSAKNGEMDDNKHNKGSGQVGDVGRLASPGPRVSGSGAMSNNTPLPSFRSERMNLSAARATNGGSSKSGGSEGGGGLPFLRSAPVSSVGSGLKGVNVSGVKSNKDKIEEKQEQSRNEDGEREEKERREYVANGADQTSNGVDNEGKRNKDVGGKEESSSKRAEVPSTAT